jgi:hypothetical protein
MNLETAFLAVRTALNGISGLPDAVLTFRHPVDPGLVFPFLCMEWEIETRSSTGITWQVADTVDVTIAVYIYISSATDHLDLELIRVRQKVVDAITALTLTRPGFKCRISNVEKLTPINVKWAAMKIDIPIGGYE